MIGAVIGDVVGSRFEFDNIKSKDFEFFDRHCMFTDDTIMTFAVAEALRECKDRSTDELSAATVRYMRELGRAFPDGGYGNSFHAWLYAKDPKPYNSFGNGAAMRISPVGFCAETEDEVKRLSRAVTQVTHDHPEGLKGAESVAMAIFWARKGASKREIIDKVAKAYYPEIKSKELSYENLLKNYGWSYGFGSVTCQSSVPQAFVCFDQGKDFEDVIRTAVSIGGDSDTIAAMAGGVAEAFFGVPPALAEGVRGYVKPLMEFTGIYI